MECRCHCILPHVQYGSRSLYVSMNQVDFTLVDEFNIDYNPNHVSGTTTDTCTQLPGSGALAQANTMSSMTKFEIGFAVILSTDFFCRFSWLLFKTQGGFFWVEHGSFWPSPLFRCTTFPSPINNLSAPTSSIRRRLRYPTRGWKRFCCSWRKRSGLSLWEWETLCNTNIIINNIMRGNFFWEAWCCWNWNNSGFITSFCEGTGRCTFVRNIFAATPLILRISCILHRIPLLDSHT